MSYDVFDDGKCARDDVVVEDEGDKQKCAGAQRQIGSEQDSGAP